MIEVRKRKDEPTHGVIFRFSRKVRRSGVLTERRKRNFRKRVANRNARRTSAIYRTEKRKELDRARKLGTSY